MFLTIGASGPGAADLGFLLGKHPDKVQRFDVSAGEATVFYPVVTPLHCQVALLVEVDAAKLAKAHVRYDDFALSPYVNRFPYAASSLLTVALGRVFGSALHGVCRDRPELVAQEWRLTVHVPTAGGDADLARSLFAPLRWDVQADGRDGCVDLTLTGEHTVQTALQHLVVLLPVLDGAKHYWVSAAEADKLLTHGADWLPIHPLRDLITARYLAHQADYIADAKRRLPSEGTLPVDAHSCQPPTMATRRVEAIAAGLRRAGARTVVDLGCGEGRLLAALATDPAFTRLVGADVSPAALARAQAGIDRLPEPARERVALVQSSAVYRDARLAGFDALVLAEVIEHIDLDRLGDVENCIFATARPRTVIVTTPNADYNPLYSTLSTGQSRHSDHRFEWTREQFHAWAGTLLRFGYSAVFGGIGDADPQLGAPTQMAVFTRDDDV